MGDERDRGSTHGERIVFSMVIDRAETPEEIASALEVLIPFVRGEVESPFSDGGPVMLHDGKRVGYWTASKEEDPWL